MSTSTSAFSLDDPVPLQADADRPADAQLAPDAPPKAGADRVLGVIGSAVLAAGGAPPPPPPET
jgi:hypothetical protein